MFIVTLFTVVKSGINSNVYQLVDRQNVVYPYPGIRFRNKNEQNIDTCYSMNELQCPEKDKSIDAEVVEYVPALGHEKGD